MFKLLLLIALSVLGVVYTIFFKPAGVCRKSRLAGCEVVLASPYARPFGVPLEYVGALWFAGVVPAYYLGVGAAWAYLGLAGVAALVALEAKLRAFCLYCTVAHVLGAAASLILLLL